jgi:hypothetical protein
MDSFECTLLGDGDCERIERLEMSLQELISDPEEHSRLTFRMSHATSMYDLNGPPPFGISRATLGSGRYGWVELTQLVPAKMLAPNWSRNTDPGPPPG